MKISIAILQRKVKLNKQNRKEKTTEKPTINNRLQQTYKLFPKADRTLVSHLKMQQHRKLLYLQNFPTKYRFDTDVRMELMLFFEVDTWAQEVAQMATSALAPVTNNAK